MKEHDISVSILCVAVDADDCKDIHQILHTKHLQHKIEFAEDWFDALMCINNHEPDIFIIDLDLPAHDYGLISKNAHFNSKRNNTIGLTSHADEDLMKKFIALGLKYVVSKPIKQEGFYYRLSELAKTLTRDKVEKQRERRGK